MVIINKTDEKFKALDNKYQKTEEKGIAGGYAPIGNDGLIPNSFIPKPEVKSILTPFCLNSCRLDTKGNPNLLSSESVKIWKYKSSSLGVFYTAQNITLAKDVQVYKDIELSEKHATIVAVDTTALTISFGTIETLSEIENEPLHYSATNYGEFYVKESLWKCLFNLFNQPVFNLLLLFILLIVFFHIFYGSKYSCHRVNFLNTMSNTQKFAFL